MKLQKKITGLLTAVLFLTASIASVQAAQNPQTTLIFEPKRTYEGIDYDVYINNTDYLSTLMFEMNFTSNEIGTVNIPTNDCFDISHSEWSNENHASLKTYFGRTGQKTGFSSDDKIKIAQISTPIDISQIGDVTVTISNAVCAGITQIDGNAVKGTVDLSDNPITYSIKECSILSFDKSTVNILSAKECNADIIYASYDSAGGLISAHRENVDLNIGENKISVNTAFDNSYSISVMVWDGIGSMRPIADKMTINN